MRITKSFALSNFVSLQKQNPKLFNRLISEFKNMSNGGTGAPYRLEYTWTTVRDQYYAEWSDSDFASVLSDFEKRKK